MAGGDAGLTAAVDAAVEAAGPMLFVDAEQVEMVLGDGPRDRTTMRLAVEAVQRRAGRPKGSPNKRTAKIRDYLLSRYTHPLEVLAATAAQDTHVLAAELRCSETEAMALRVKAAAELAPYLESRMPVAITGNLDGHMTLVMQAGPAPIDGGALIPSGADALMGLSFAASPETVQSQGLGGADRGASE